MSCRDTGRDGKFSLSHYDCIGFDMDHTLVQYRLPEVFKLTYTSLATYLVEFKGHDRGLLEGGFDKLEDFCIRGLIFETKRGDFFKVAKDGRILRACHGTKEIPHDQLVSAYGNPPVWPHFHELNERCYHGVHFRIFENFHDMPAAVVCARLIDILDSKHGWQQSYTVWDDVVSALSENYASTAFQKRSGMYFPSIISDPERYVKRCSRDLVRWVRSVKAAGKVTFLMTSSFVDYTVFLMEFAFGERWQELFDFVITNARKPRFFEKDGENQPFYVTDGSKTECHEADAIHSHEIYSQGNATLLRSFLEKRLKRSDLKFLYFGDSLKSDVFPPYAYAKWDTVVVLEEMEAEDTYHRLSFAEEAPISNSSIMEEKQPRHEPLNQEEKLIIASRQWGSFFCHRLNGSESEKEADSEHINTYWADMIANHSRLAVPTLDCLTDLPLDHVFPPSCPKTRVAFYPFVPGTIR